MTGICFRDQLWLNSYPLDRNLVFNYFALSPFHDRTCDNEQLRMRSILPLNLSQLSAAFEPKVGKETIDFKEVKRVDHILASLQRKLPPAPPPPPPFPEGYIPPATAESEKGPETQQAGEAQPPTVDPIIDQGPAKRMRF